MSKVLHFIYNPVAGSLGSERKVRSAVREMERLGARLVLLPTHGPGSATDLARQAVREGARRVVVAGGDGTINEALNGIDIPATELAIIPAGTANILALEIGVPFNAREAARVAVRGKASHIDLGLAGERYFALMAGVGFDALAIKNLNPVLKKTIRQAAFPISGLKTFIKHELPLLHISAGEHEAEGYFVVISNSRYYGGLFGPNPDASATDGLLDVCVLKEKNLQGMVGFWLVALAKAKLEAKWAEYFRTAELEVTCPSGEHVLVQTDGDVIGELPMQFSVVPKALRVCRGVL